MVETEEEFGRDLQQVVERYLKPLDNPDVPRIVRDNKDIIFTNLKQIADFHNTYVCSLNGFREENKIHCDTFARKKETPSHRKYYFFTYKNESQIRDIDQRVILINLLLFELCS